VLSVGINRSTLFCTNGVFALNLLDYKRVDFETVDNKDIQGIRVDNSGATAIAPWCCAGALYRMVSR
jgi:hypothetical protein